jgi:hypothetical protein
MRLPGADGGDGRDHIRVGDGYLSEAFGGDGPDNIRVGDGYRAFIAGGSGDDYIRAGDGTVGVDEVSTRRMRSLGRMGRT